MPEIHCANFDSSYEGCRKCPGKVEVTQKDGTVDVICRAGEAYIKALLDNPRLSVYPINFPNAENRE